jgi:alpha-mannosidase
MFDTLFDDERLVGLNETRLQERVLNFLQQLATQSNRTKGNHIMLTMGTDFTYKEAHVGFSNYDLLIGTIMNYQTFHKVNVTEIFGPRFNRVNIFYSNPDYYTEQKYRETIRSRQQQQSQQMSQSASSALWINDDGEDDEAIAKSEPFNWTVKTDDFFPYSDGPNSFWTGYFTSRSGLKRFERVASSFLLAARQIDALPEPSSTKTPVGDEWARKAMHGNDGNSGNHDDSPLFDLEDAVGVVQHHDGVSGTAKQHVADDYSLRLATGMNRAALHVTQKLRRVMLAAVSEQHQTKDTQQLANLSYCPLLNETVCSVSEVRPF